MSRFTDLLLQFLAQIGGGPGPPENNLVRFALPAIFWAILLAVSWSRRHEGSARERFLLWGFGLALFRELFMLGHLSRKLLSSSAQTGHNSYIEPLEHLLGMTAIIVITAAFLRYILDDPILPRNYLIVGLAVVTAGCIATAIWWPQQLALHPEVRFNMTLPAWMLHSVQLFLIGAAIFVLIRKKGWLRNVVIVALSFLFLSQLLALINYMTGHVYNVVLCPISNNLHIWAVPIFGFVYFHELGLEKRQAENALLAYRDRLQDLVDIRTAELQKANVQLERAAVIEERQRIAAEMHDGLAQTLSTMGLKTGEISALLQSEKLDEGLRELDGMHDIISMAINDVRRSIASLQENPQPKLPLQDALRRTAMDVSAANGNPAIEFSAIEQPIYLDKCDQEQVMRIVQEALQNACRHASAQQIKVELRRDSERFQISVTDNGLGFDPAGVDVGRTDHFGLSIMRARASRIDGALSIISSPGSGTVLVLLWPNKATDPHDFVQTKPSEIRVPS